jgi:hypothetical protein
MKEKKPATIKITGEFEVSPSVRLGDITNIISTVRKTLQEIGTGDIKVTMPRGSYEV